ncbi:MAG: hypothetical protein AAGI01_14085, partial [Myxococcota bacterium]
MSADPHAIETLVAQIPELLNACLEETVERITIEPSGRWSITRSGRMVMQESMIDIGVLRRFVSEVQSRAQATVMRAWSFGTLAGGGGSIVVGERLLRPRIAALPGAALDELHRLVAEGANACILGPPGAGKRDFLAWMTRLFPEEQIMLVSELPPGEALGPRVVHAYPPEHEVERRAMSRVLRHAEVVLWDRAIDASDVSIAITHAGARRRWFTMDADELRGGLEALRRSLAEVDAHGLGAVLVVVPADEGPALSHIILRDGDRWLEKRWTQTSAVAIVEDLFPIVDAIVPARSLQKTRDGLDSEHRELDSRRVALSDVELFELDAPADPTPVEDIPRLHQDATSTFSADSRPARLEDAQLEDDVVVGHVHATLDESTDAEDDDDMLDASELIVDSIAEPLGSDFIQAEEFSGQKSDQILYLDDEGLVEFSDPADGMDIASLLADEGAYSMDPLIEDIEDIDGLAGFVPTPSLDVLEPVEYDADLRISAELDAQTIAAHDHDIDEEIDFVIEEEFSDADPV